MPPKIIPKMPQKLLRPTTPSKTEAMKISKNNHSEFHHFASFAEKQTTNHIKPAMADITLALPYTFFPCVETTLSMMSSFDL